MMRSDELKERIAALKQELVETEKEERKLESGSPVAVAELLHSKFCHHNHTDGCSWGYKEKNWQAPTHQEYLKKAEALITKAKRESITPQQLTKVIQWL